MLTALRHMLLASLLLLAAWGSGLSTAAAAAAPAPSDGCSAACPELLAQPLLQWSAERAAATVYTLPWNASYVFEPLDYSSLAKEVCACLEPTLQDHGAAADGDFVTRNGTRLELGGAPFRFMGFNHPQLVRYAASPDPARQRYLTELLDRAEELGLRVFRTWAHFEGYDVRQPGSSGGEFGWLSLQEEPGKYNETTFQALDRVLFEAGQRGQKVILSLADYWGAFGAGQAGFEPFLQWVKGSLNVSDMTILDFYRDPRVRLLFKANMCRMVNRVNVVTGVKYRDDPTIMAWELMNEPKCPGCFNNSDQDALLDWTAEMSAFLKCIDPHHLVSVGSEGNYGPSSPWRYADMPGAWALCLGQDYDRTLSLPSIDYGTAHVYESQRGNWDEFQREFCGWEECTMPWLEAWITSHLNESRALGKPFILEEFNVAYNEQHRNEMFELVQRLFQADIAAHPEDSAAAGAMFWQAALQGAVNTDGFNIYLDGSLAVPPPEGIYGEKQSDPTTLFLNEVRRMEDDMRRQHASDTCMDQIKIVLTPIYEQPGLKNYSSNSTVALLADLAAEASAFSEEAAAEAAPLAPTAEPPWAAAAGPACGSESNTSAAPLSSCQALDQLPFAEWEQQQAGGSGANSSWAWPGTPAELPPVDYPAVAEAVCDCMTRAQEPGTGPPNASFAQRQGDAFLLDGQPFFFAGFNAPRLVQWAYRSWPGDRAAVDALLRDAARLGFPVGRVAVPGEGPDLRVPSERALFEPYGDVWVSLQPSAAQFDEAAFQALDFVLHSASQHGVRLILVVGSTGSAIGQGAAGTPATYMQWLAGSLNITGTTILDFYTEPRARLLFKNLLCTLVHRVNSYSGIAYRDDPAIFAWELLDDPRCPGCPGASKGAVVTAWADEMTSFLKCIDPHHLVSVAQLGWFGDSSPEERAADNPALDFECEGADFLQLSSLPAVDYAAYQMSDEFSGFDQATQQNCGWGCHLPWFERWMASHLNDTQELLGKPLVLTSVSKTYHEAKRNQLFELVGSAVSEARQASGPDSVAAGVLFSAASVWNQTDWDGVSVYLDGSLPAPAPDRTEPYPPGERAFLDAVRVMTEGFERKDVGDDCRARATALHMHLYNTTALKVYWSNSTVDLIGEMAAAAADGTF